MFNFYVTAVRLNYKTIDKVPSAYQAQVKEALGMVDPVEELEQEQITSAEQAEETVAALEENTTEEQLIEA